MSNDITINLSISDSLLEKLMAALAPPAPSQRMAIPSALLGPLMAGAMGSPSDKKEEGEEKPAIGFKADK
jgi:hypothetical protein